jgi:hypothetical protein
MPYRRKRTRRYTLILLCLATTFGIVALIFAYAYLPDEETDNASQGTIHYLE